MKWFLSAVILFLFLGSIASAGVIHVIGSGIPSGAECIEYLSETGGSAGNLDICDHTSFVYGCQRHEMAEEKTICQIDAYLTWAIGSSSGKTFTMSIWTLDGFDMDANQGSSDSVNGSDAWSDTQVAFSFSSPVALTTQDYYFCITCDQGVDASNWAHWEYAAPGVVYDDLISYHDSDGVRQGYINQDFRMKLYAQ